MKLRKNSLFRLAAAAMLTLALIVTATSCSGDNLIDEVPQPISKFIAQYYPGYGVGQYESTADGYHVRLKNGPGMNFNTSYSWTSLDGYGLPLPQVFLFDQTPPKLYEYLQGTSALNSVFSISRTDKEYTVTLLDSSLIYNIETGNITAP